MGYGRMTILNSISVNFDDAISGMRITWTRLRCEIYYTSQVYKYFRKDNFIANKSKSGRAKSIGDDIAALKKPKEILGFLTNLPKSKIRIPKLQNRYPFNYRFCPGNYPYKVKTPC